MKSIMGTLLFLGTGVTFLWLPTDASEMALVRNGVLSDNYYSYPSGCIATYPQQTAFTFSSYSKTMVKYVTGTTVTFLGSVGVTFLQKTTICTIEGSVIVLDGTTMTFPTNAVMTVSAGTAVRYGFGAKIRHVWNGISNGMGTVEWPEYTTVTVATPENDGSYICSV